MPFTVIDRPAPNDRSQSETVVRLGTPTVRFMADCSQSHCRREGPKQTSAPTVAEHGQADEQQPFFEFLSAGSPTVLAARNTFVARRRQQAFKLS